MTRPRKKDRHLPPCVYPKHGAYWYVKKGKWTRLGDTLASALRAYAERFEAPQGTMDKLIDSAMDVIKPGLKRNTVRQYEIAARKLKAAFVEFSPEQVTPKHVAGFKTGMVATPNMCNRCLSLLRQVFDYALEHEMVDSNPAIGIRRHEEKKRTRLLSDKEYDAIYAKAGPRLQIIIDLLYLTGQRITAVLKIHRSDITEAGVRFPQHKTDTKRIIKMTPELKAVIDRAKALGGGVTSLTLLRGRGGKAPDYRSVRLQWDNACQAAGVEDANLHDIRAKAATDAEKQGLNATALLGHTNVQQTRRYLRGKEEPVVEGPSFRRLLDTSTKS